MPRLQDKNYKIPYFDEIIEKDIEDETFVIGQCYEEEAATTLKCKLCGKKEFFVGIGDYYTAISCKNCKWQHCIHDG